MASSELALGLALAVAACSPAPRAQDAPPLVSVASSAAFPASATPPSLPVPPTSDVARCDDSTSCPAGTLCCANGGKTVCADPSREPCVVEACRPGTCRTPATDCSEERLGGAITTSCQSTVARVACGGKLCEGATPVCVLDPKSARRAGRCVGLEESAPGVRYACDSAKDCGEKMVCCGSADGATGTACAFQCAWGVASYACDSDADCTRFPNDEHARALARCALSGNGPPGLKLCQPR